MPPIAGFARCSGITVCTKGPVRMRPSVRNSKGIRWLAVASLTIPLAVFSTSSAQAADGPYNIDGVVPDAGTTELPDLFGSVKELGPLNSSTTKIGVIHNDAVPTLGLTNPNGQVDLRRAWLDTERDAGTETGCTSRGSATPTAAAASSPTSSCRTRRPPPAPTTRPPTLS